MGVHENKMLLSDKRNVTRLKGKPTDGVKTLPATHLTRD
jgi:hypothetical protein